MFFHPSEVCMNYYSHFRVSIRFAFILFIGTVKATVHSFLPDWYITSTSDTVDTITKLLNDTGCRKQESEHIQ